jgi:precorrin-6B C5,15-methyltransferase / cobalt-precorrin-6B C5,C15-methyltransferase
MSDRVCIIGIGSEGADSLGAAARRIIAEAEIVCGGRRLLEMFPGITAEKVTIGAGPEQIADLIGREMAKRRVVVLASGDPGFFGIAHLLTERLGRENLRIIPQLSSAQLAFAAIGLSWDDAAFVSLHGRPLDTLRPALTTSGKIAVLTDRLNTPGVIAEFLLDIGLKGWGAFVCQNMGTDKQSCVEYSLAELARQKTFADLNILILKAADDYRRPFGLHEKDFIHQGRASGLITKQEVRAVALSKLNIAPANTIWDIGSASGSVAIEASRLARQGMVYAVEKSVGAEAVIRQNISRFQSWNVIPVIGEAPECLAELPSPDGVFIGGSGGRIGDIISVVAKRLKPGGRVVINIIALENLSKAGEAMKLAGLSAETVLHNIARSVQVGKFTRMSPLSPVYIISGVKDEQ